MTTQATTIQIADVEPDATNTTGANRIAELASYLKACTLVGATPDPALVAENQALTAYRQVDLADNHLVIETDSNPGPIVTEGTEHEEDSPATGWVVANGIISVALTFRPDGTPAVLVENLSEKPLPVQISCTDNGQDLYLGTLTTS